MFEILWLLAIISVVYVLVKHEKRLVRIGALSYFILFAVVFQAGSIYISRKYQLYNGPAIDGGFSNHFDWVNSFALLFLVPLGVLLYYKFLTKLFRNLKNRFLAVVAAIIVLAVLLAALYIGMFIFILTFYGFAP